jgi:AcrR family transcriptional regulator
MDATRREQRQNRFRREILDAAGTLFSELGYEAFSMRLLARRLGCSHGNLYPHFGNKEQLFDCLVEEHFVRLYEELQQRIAGYEDGDPVGLIETGFRVYVDFGLRNPHAYKLTFLVGGADTDRPWRPHAAFEFLRSVVRRCVEEKRFRPVDVETTSQALWAAMHGVTSLLILRPTFPWVPRDQLIQQVIDNALAGLMRPSRSAAPKKRGPNHVEHSRRRAGASNDDPA